ncbi:hypothetical protein LTR37_017866 [Vermiconidia calcicola]|uniref:Uncharacterized protein n=1 Tax=Vermiconidia calcicola TaxID=1690605 RepID=A0ACC3MIP3_9PEZI|nr:hypothetical protein LTR37_017866 [Vermiconidia calcicola]
MSSALPQDELTDDPSDNVEEEPEENENEPDENEGGGGSSTVAAGPTTAATPVGTTVTIVTTPATADGTTLLTAAATTIEPLRPGQTPSPATTPSGIDSTNDNIAPSAILSTVSGRTVYITTSNDAVFTITAGAQRTMQNQGSLATFTVTASGRKSTGNGDSGSSGLSSGESAGVAFGILIPTLFVIVLLFYLRRRRRADRFRNNPTPEGAGSVQTPDEKSEDGDEPKGRGAMYAAAARSGHSNDPAEATSDSESEPYDGRYGGTAQLPDDRTHGPYHYMPYRPPADRACEFEHVVNRAELGHADVAELGFDDRPIEAASGTIRRKSLPRYAELEGERLRRSEMPTSSQSPGMQPLELPSQAAVRSPQSAVSPPDAKTRNFTAESPRGIVSP